jgi:hypothetical protein
MTEKQQFMWATVERGVCFIIAIVLLIVKLCGVNYHWLWIFVPFTAEQLFLNGYAIIATPFVIAKWNNAKFWDEG